MSVATMLWWALCCATFLVSSADVSPPSVITSFEQVRGSPYTVSYDERSILITPLNDGRNDTQQSQQQQSQPQRVLLLGGSFHYPRAAVEEWRGILERMKRDGLNHIQMYPFWNLHEAHRGTFDFSDASRANITRFLQTAADVGLFVNFRIGPYVCGEWNFGGLPLWLRELPGVVFRDNNVVWKREMELWVRRLAEMIEPFLARNGGPIILSQIENEYNPQWFGAEQPEEYVEWCGDLAESLELDIPFMMCNGKSAENTVNSFNGNEGSAYAAEHSASFPGQPLLYTENEMGMGEWKDNGWDNSRTPEDVAHSVASWFAFGASHHNYYMWEGGNHVRRWAGSGVTTKYADNAPMHSDSLPNEPMRSHLARLHALINEHAATILGSAGQMQNRLERLPGADPMLVPARNVAQLGTAPCATSGPGRASQRFVLANGAIEATVDGKTVCVDGSNDTVTEIQGLNAVPIARCAVDNPGQIFNFTQRSGADSGSLCTDRGLCLRAVFVWGHSGVTLVNSSYAKAAMDCQWVVDAKTGSIRPFAPPSLSIDDAPLCLTSGIAWGVCGRCNPGPCTCAYLYSGGGDDGGDTFAFVQNAGNVATTFSLPNSSGVLSVPPQSISLVVGGETVYNTATITSCSDPKTNCSLPTLRRYAPLNLISSWRRWTEPAILGPTALASATNASRPLEQLNVTKDETDYLFYQRQFSLATAVSNGKVHVGTTLCNGISVFVDGVLAGSAVDLSRPLQPPVELSIPVADLGAGTHTLTIVAASLGITNYPDNGDASALPKMGIIGDVTLEVGGGGANVNLTAGTWSHRVGLAGELANVMAAGSTVPSEWAHSAVVPSVGDTLPLSWFRATFKVPAAPLALATGNEASLLLDCSGMGRGHLWLNGEDIGRYYPLANDGKSQRYYFLPPSLLRGEGQENVLVLGEVLGAAAVANVSIVLSTVYAPQPSDVEVLGQ